MSYFLCVVIPNAYLIFKTRRRRNCLELRSRKGESKPNYLYRGPSLFSSCCYTLSSLHIWDSRTKKLPQIKITKMRVKSKLFLSLYTLFPVLFPLCCYTQRLLYIWDSKIKKLPRIKIQIIVVPFFHFDFSMICFVSNDKLLSETREITFHTEYPECINYFFFIISWSEAPKKITEKGDFRNHIYI